VLENITIEAAIVVIIGYIVVSVFSYAVGRTRGILLGTDTTIAVLARDRYIAFNSQGLKEHPDAGDGSIPESFEK